MANQTFIPIIPDDNNDLPAGPTESVWVGVGGNIALCGGADTVPVVFTNVPGSGWWRFVPYPIVRICATNTTATNLVMVRGRTP